MLQDSLCLSSTCSQHSPRSILEKTPPEGAVSTTGRVVLNVGGRRFETYASTLTCCSSYFCSQFSDVWSSQHLHHHHGKEQHHPFIDQDPEAFAVLLSFMRCGFIKEDELTEKVLFQAELFGVDQLVREVKMKAYRSYYPGFSGDDDTAARKFVEEFGSIAQAVTSGLLPGILQRNKPRYEYATLYMHRRRGDAGRVVPCYAGLCSKLFETDPPSLPPERRDQPTDAGGFMHPIFALNFLGKYGFRLADAPFQNYCCDAQDMIDLPDDRERPSRSNRGRQLGEWLFVRRSTVLAEHSEKSQDKAIIRPRQSRQNNEPREFASLNWTMGMGAFITASGGNIETFPRLGGASLRNVGVARFKNMALAMEWLERKGFHDRETELEGILQSVVASIWEISEKSRHFGDNMDIHVGRTLIFSRPLKENERLINNVVPLAYSSELINQRDGLFFAGF